MTDEWDGAQSDGRAVSRETTSEVARATPERAYAVFGHRVSLATSYVELLAGAGIERGLIGPREAPRLWDRHVLNSAVVQELIDPNVSVADVGSGAGLPGIPLAIARPDLDVALVEPMARRTAFLEMAIEVLELANVTVVRARAEEYGRAQPGFDVVTARAVAPMDRLAGWALPMIHKGGRLLALKGASVEDELQKSATQLRRHGAISWTVEVAGSGVVEPPTRVAVIVRG